MNAMAAEGIKVIVGPVGSPEVTGMKPVAKRNRMVVMRGRTVTDIDLLTVAHRQRLVPDGHPLVCAARDVGTSLGD